MDKNRLKEELFNLVFKGAISTLQYGQLINKLSTNKLQNFEILNIVNNYKIMYNN